MFDIVSEFGLICILIFMSWLIFEIGYFMNRTVEVEHTVVSSNSVSKIIVNYLSTIGDC